MARRVAILIAIVLLSLTQVGTAVAGGWAISVFDDAPAELEANTTYDIRYTILQHGETPVNQAEIGTTSITFTPADSGEAVTFPGEPTDVPGQYVAQVTVPEAGSWSWEVLQGIFGVQELGTITVLDGQDSAVATTLEKALRVGLPLATLIALALFTAQVIAFRGHRPEAGLSDSVG
ncbi:MAG: hypothetical protein ABFR53_05390 [Actinomycetota bacterium]